MLDGIYRIYNIRFDENDQEHRKMAGRLWVEGGQIRHLEDHGNMEELFPEGPVTSQSDGRMKRLQASPYHEVIHEADLAQGFHEHELPKLDLGPMEADQKFIMTGEGLDDPQHVEMWDDAIKVDGRRLDDTEAHHLLGEVAAGRLVLTPIE